MRGKYGAYLWATAVFLLFSATDTLFALPEPGRHDHQPDVQALPSCRSDTGMPSMVASSRERANGEVPMLTPSRILKNLACTFSGH
jgi:hypothetical protein